MVKLLAPIRQDSYDENLFLYGEENEGLVKEYIQKKNDENDGEINDDESLHDLHPPFLLPAYGANRIIEFYSPWCQHCRHFKSKFMALAVEANNATGELGKIEFYAISCAAYQWLCMENKVPGYPTIRAYKQGASPDDFQTMKTFTVEALSSIFGIEHQGVDDISSKQNFDSTKEFLETSNLVSKVGRGSSVGIHSTILSSDNLSRTKVDIFHDAALSLINSLKSDIFSRMSKSGVYNDSKAIWTQKQQSVLVEWIDLLYWSLPSSWKIHSVINAIRLNFDVTESDKEDMIRIVNSHEGVVIEDNNYVWSRSCSHDIPNAGYSCGLWNLFHIISVGVAENNKAVIGDRDRSSTHHVVRTVKDFIDQFFGCDICRQTFQRIYTDTCGYKTTCKRFPKKHRKDETLEHWRDLAIWLWEVHNAINIDIFTKQMTREGKAVSNEDIERVIWPSKIECSRCRKPNSENWDHTELYMFIKSQYWPEHVQNFRYVVLNKKGSLHEEDDESTITKFMIIIGIVVTLYMLWRKQKRSRRYHKLKNKQ